MNNLLIILVIACLAGSIAYERWATNDALQKLYELKQNGNEEAFLRAIDSPYVRMHISKFARAFIKLNYWIEQDQEERVKEIIPLIHAMKCRSEDKTALHLKLLGYALKKGWHAQAREYISAIQHELKDQTSRQAAELRMELRHVEEKYLAGTAATPQIK